MKMFAVYDSAAECYSLPFYRRSTGEALRAFTAAANDGKSLESLHPDQITLFEIGSFDEQTCTFEMLHTAKSLGKALEYQNTGLHSAGV